MLHLVLFHFLCIRMCSSGYGQLQIPIYSLANSSHMPDMKGKPLMPYIWSNISWVKFCLSVLPSSLMSLFSTLQWQRESQCQKLMKSVSDLPAEPDFIEESHEPSRLQSEICMCNDALTILIIHVLPASNARLKSKSVQVAAAGCCRW